MKLYLDIFFLVNLGMNFVILLAESFFHNRRIALKRLILTAAFGAGVACLCVVTGMHRIPVLLIVCYALVSVVLVRMAFGKTTIGTWVRNVLFFYTIAFLLGGMLVQVRELFSFSLSSLVVLGTASTFLLLLRWILPKWRRWQSAAGVYHRVRLYYQDKKVAGNALWDTGNRLQEPFTGEPVLLGERKFLSHLWRNGEEPVLRIIPFHSVGREMGLLHVFQADYIEVEKENEWYRVNNPWVAICDHYLSADGEYEMILHPEMLQEE